jgi:hypothetical protein
LVGHDFDFGQFIGCFWPKCFGTQYHPPKNDTFYAGMGHPWIQMQKNTTLDHSIEKKWLGTRKHHS